MSIAHPPRPPPHGTPPPKCRVRRSGRPASSLGSLVAGAVTALVLTLVVFPGATESVITGSLLVGFGSAGRCWPCVSARRTSQPQRWAAVPAVAMTVAGAGLVVFSPAGRRPHAGSPGCGRRLHAGPGGLDVRPDAPRPARPRPLAADAGAASCWPPPRRRRRAGHHLAPRPGRLPGPGTDLRGGRPPAAPGLPGTRRPDRGALQRPRRDLRLLGPDHRRGRRHHPRVRLRPRRPGVERRRRRAPGRRGGRRGPARPAGRSRRGGPLRPRRTLHRRPLRDDLRRAVPRAGGRHGAAGQLQPAAAHRHPGLPRPVRRDAARPGPAAHAGAVGLGPADRPGSQLPAGRRARVDAMASTVRAQERARRDRRWSPRCSSRPRH